MGHGLNPTRLCLCFSTKSCRFLASILRERSMDEWVLNPRRVHERR